MILSATLLVALTTVTMSFTTVSAEKNNDPITVPVFLPAWFVNVQGYILAFPSLECATEYANLTGGTLWGTGTVEAHQFSQCLMDF